jgi:hypothetical protein
LVKFMPIFHDRAMVDRCEGNCAAGMGLTRESVAVSTQADPDGAPVAVDQARNVSGDELAARGG